jgi:hypothetical protein
MAAMKIRRNAATPKGFLRRVDDCGFEGVTDPRHASWVVHPLVGVLKLGALALATHARSTRAVETRSEQLRGAVRDSLGLSERVSDNAFGQILPALDWLELRRGLHRQVKAEARRGNLDPTHLSKSTVAIDGKHLATIPEKRLRNLISQRTELDGHALEPEQLRRVLRTQFPYVQLQHGDDGRLHGLVAAHRATLVSAAAAPTIDQWPLAGKTNEWGTIKVTVSTLLKAYSRTRLVERVTLDAGNATPNVAEQLAEHEVDYFMTLKTSQGALHQQARDLLAGRPGRQAQHRVVVDERGKMICYTVWQAELDEEHGFDGARQVFRIERVAASDEDATVGTRYFVSSEAPEQLGAEEALKLARAHWRCENEGHWTADAIFDEDARRTPWTQHPVGVLVVGLLRLMAVNILAVLRALSRYKRAEKWLTPTWKMVYEHALLSLCEPILDMQQFNACDG